jgi:hypothetical protein
MIAIGIDECDELIILSMERSVGEESVGESVRGV